jgi:hypothetical protein
VLLLCVLVASSALAQPPAPVVYVVKVSNARHSQLQKFVVLK